MPVIQTGRRAFAGICAAVLALALAACASVPATSAAAGERNVAITTPDGIADALLFTPTGQGRHPAVILWPDLTGLRPAFADMGRQLAGAGYVVLVPNAFYRSVKLDGRAETAQPRLPFGETMQRGAPWRAAASDAAIMADTQAYVSYLNALPQVDPQAGTGMLGVDIGGAHAFVGARGLPGQIAAVAAIHPLSIATPRDTSPHLFVAQSKAEYLVSIAQPDDEREPEDKGDLRAAFADAGLAGTVEIVPAGHGFMVADDPAYDRTAAGAVMAQVTALFAKALR